MAGNEISPRTADDSTPSKRPARGNNLEKLVAGVVIVAIFFLRRREMLFCVTRKIRKFRDRIIGVCMWCSTACYVSHSMWINR
jgi:hypothetical protein